MKYMHRVIRPENTKTLLRVSRLVNLLTSGFFSLFMATAISLLLISVSSKYSLTRLAYAFHSLFSSSCQKRLFIVLTPFIIFFGGMIHFYLISKISININDAFVNFWLKPDSNVDDEKDVFPFEGNYLHGVFDTDTGRIYKYEMDFQSASELAKELNESSRENRFAVFKKPSKPFLPYDFNKFMDLFLGEDETNDN